ncbi:A/G-specific adenine glycosylase [Usitatibacter rugosus]|uniref:A/G-specific adenine glycosylase n=1 Tax=Usitatibacter rugosus TaxID=2732067 RepID=UPI0014887C56|nr:A/G-specific adenine glycosylase [Usitatibacter rugosus]
MPAKTPSPTIPAFAARIVRWQVKHGRHGLPWQASNDAYRRWLSEVMLQQTQVATVIPYFERFLVRFPDVAALAAASEGDVLALWSGLGYYARGRNLHRAAREVVERFGGVFPVRFDELESLPGVGRSTAAAIAAFAGGERRAILDGNVKRVIARHAGIGGDPSSSPVLEALWDAAEARLPAKGIEAYTQGMMDLGATVCLARNPRCDICPVRIDCVAANEERVDELPGRKKRAARKHRSTAMLVAISKGEVLLVKRPSPGIWGGLWSLPEMLPGDVPKRATPLPPFEHAFTHYTLAVRPFQMDGASPEFRLFFRNSGEAPSIWLALDDVAQAALPAPVKKLLLEITRSASAASGTGGGSRAAPKRRAARAASASRRS